MPNNHCNIQTIKGFLLTRGWRDTPQGITLTFWAHTELGPAQIIIPAQQAVCFIEKNNKMNLPAHVERKSLDLFNLNNAPVDGLYFKHQRDLNKLRQHFSYDKTLLHESEIKPADRYLMERFITAPLQIIGHSTQKKGYLEFINPQLKPTDYTPDLSWVSLDIETEDFRGKLYSIAVTTQSHEQVFMVTDKPPVLAKEKTTTNEKIAWCKTEKDALTAFFEWIRKNDPDVIIGWNVIGFDLNFLQWKCKQLKISFDLGRSNPFEQQANILAPQQNGHMYLARIPGRVVLDGISCLRGAFWSFESFALDFVAEKLLGRKKLINDLTVGGDIFGEVDEVGEVGITASTGLSKVEEIRRQYREDPLALAEYNLEDCRLVADIFAKTDLFNFSIQRARMTGLAIDRQGGSSAAFDNLYLPQLHRKGYVASDIGSHPNQQHSPGGYVMESQPGLYENVLVLDFKSLYPSIIRTFKIDPLGLIAKDDKDDAIPGFLEAEFSRCNHILPDIVSELWKERDIAKKENNQPLSQAIKIIMNSFYGVLGSFGCRFFNPQLASSITLRGHEIIQTSKDLIEKEGYTVIYGDTDSVFILIGDNKTEDECLKVGRSLQDTLNSWWSKHLKETFNIASNLEIEFETHYLRFLMPTIRGAEKGSKKRYAGMIKKGQSTQMVFKGLESVRSDWTPLAREFQQSLYELIFNKQPYEELILGTYEALLKGELDDKLTYTKRLRRPLESYTSTQPPQVKAAKKMKNAFSKNQSRKIQYVMTTFGPEPIENITSPPDYHHYIDKQLAPVADSILYFLDTSFERITARQMDVFD